jgi:hypothetical protein
MAHIRIRNVPDDTVESYRQKAKLKGRSLEQELRGLLERNKPFTPAERLALSRRYRTRYPDIQRSLTLWQMREGLE